MPLPIVPYLLILHFSFTIHPPSTPLPLNNFPFSPIRLSCLIHYITTKSPFTTFSPLFITLFWCEATQLPTRSHYHSPPSSFSFALHIPYISDSIFSISLQLAAPSLFSFCLQFLPLSIYVFVNFANYTPLVSVLIASPLPITPNQPASSLPLHTLVNLSLYLPFPNLPYLSPSVPLFPSSLTHYTFLFHCCFIISLVLIPYFSTITHFSSYCHLPHLTTSSVTSLSAYSTTPLFLRFLSACLLSHTTLLDPYIMVPHFSTQFLYT